MIRMIRFFQLWVTSLMVLALAGAAYAQVAPPSPTWPAAWIPLVATALGVVGALLRNYTPSTGFFHTTIGHAAIMLGISLISGGASVFQSGHVDKASLIAALIGALSGWLGALKTGSSDSGALSETVKAVVVLLIFGTVLSGCGYCTVQAHKAEPRCQAQAVVVDCGAPATIKLIKEVVMPLIIGLISGGDTSAILDNALATLESQGYHDAVDLIDCAIGVLFHAPAPGNLQAAQNAAHEKAQLWTKAHKGKR